MGFVRRVVTPKPAKKAIRAVERPAKTARQLITPTPVKKAVSRAWRAADPSVGIQQEVEGRAIADTRRRLRSSGQRVDPADYAREQQEVFDESVAGMARAGWTPQETSAQIVPVLSEIKPFLVLESARLDALRELQHAIGDEAELEALAIVNALSVAQMKMLAEICDEAASEPFDEDAARFWSWTYAWRDVGRIEIERRTEQQKALFARMPPAATERAGARGQQRLNEIVRRADG